MTSCAPDVYSLVQKSSTGARIRLSLRFPEIHTSERGSGRPDCAPREAIDSLLHLHTAVQSVLRRSSCGMQARRNGEASPVRCPGTLLRPVPLAIDDSRQNSSSGSEGRGAAALEREGTGRNGGEGRINGRSPRSVPRVASSKFDEAAQRTDGTASEASPAFDSARVQTLDCWSVTHLSHALFQTDSPSLGRTPPLRLSAFSPTDRNSPRYEKTSKSTPRQHARDRQQSCQAPMDGLVTAGEWREEGRRARTPFSPSFVLSDRG